MNFLDSEITAKGHVYLAKVFGGEEFELSAAWCGDGIYDGDAWDIGELVSPKLQGAFIKVAPDPRNRRTQLVIRFTNETVKEFFMLREIAVFVSDPDEGDIVFAYARAGERANYIEAYNGKWFTEDEITLYIYTASVEKIKADIIKSSRASEIEYDNSKAELAADNVQDAIDEIDQNVDLLTEKFYRQAMSGNVRDHIRWAMGYPHIGGVRVQPLFLGANTVRVLIIDDAGDPAPLVLVDGLQFYLDPNSAGLGNGAAPIGAHVTVAAGMGLMLDISAVIQLAEDYTSAEGVSKAMKHYIYNAASENGCIDCDELTAVLQSMPSIAGVSGLQINGETAAIILGDNDVPIIKNLMLEVV